MNICDIRQSLVKEAQMSPMLLTDLAGLEEYISESYNNRSFIELLQNADDAYSTKFVVKKHNGYLIIANNGRIFNQQDIESLCRSASSNKVRGNSIGYRGIGFKSVVSIAKEVHLISGDLEVTFSKELTLNLLPLVKHVPLIRIPHPIRKEVKNHLNHIIQMLRNDGLRTFFIFSDIAGAKIDEEYSSFQYTALLFLKHIKNVSIELNSCINISLSNVSLDKVGRELTITIDENVNVWQVYSENNIDIAFSVQGDKVVRLPKNEAFIHAFLPTEDTCGLGVLINGDFSTDPSRRHLIFDETTFSVIRLVAKLYVHLLNHFLYIEDEYAKNIVTALMPSFDVRMLQLTNKTFEKHLINLIQESANGCFGQLALMPTWFNAKDFNTIQSVKGESCIGKEYYAIDNLIPLLKSLGAKEFELINFFFMNDSLNISDISIHGCAQIAHIAIRDILLNKSVPNFENSSIFYSQSKRVSLKEIEVNNLKIDQAFLDLIYEKGTNFGDICNCLKKLSLLSLQKTQFSEDVKGANFAGTTIGILNNENKVFSLNLFESNNKSGVCKQCEVDSSESLNDVFEWLDFQVEKKNIKNKPTTRWRSAEELTLDVFNTRGFQLEDVASQNLGYDLEGFDPKGRRIFIEIKSITFVGQKFRMTNNEFAVAQIKQDCYYIAIVMQTHNNLEISLIKNPINCLNLNRQCVQWVWECSDYEFKPMKFSL